MSDMSGPRSLPPGAAHDQHDTLLVAQLASADPLPEGQHRAAASLIAGCPACATLAADLSAIQRAVAQEPMPPRRRDHRISAAQAERLRGSVLRRFLRRLALPEADALRPLAASVLSVGLLFVVAGTVWPEDLAPGGDSPAVAPQDLQALPGSLADGVVAPGARTEPPSVSAPDVDAGADTGVGASVADDLQLEAAFRDADPAAEELRSEGLVAEGAARSGLSPEDEADTSAAKAVDPPQANEALAASDSLESPSTASPPLESLQSTAAEVDPDLRGRASTLETDALAATASDAEQSVETALIVIGSLLAVGGLALLALVWLARRVAGDPLLR